MVPVPEAARTPPQQNLYSPVAALISTTLPEFTSSCRQKLKTVTEKVQEAEFPDVSVAVHVTVVVPTGKGDPEVTITPFWFLQTTTTPGQLSVAVTFRVTGVVLAGGQLTGATRVPFVGGQKIAGGCIS